jgi:pyruvate/2-oxoglutarate dehydrogenase complex dihydrolipoamide dehydrogenase (E3) component
MSERFDVIVIGAGISGETCARRLRHAGMRVALIERDRIGGECAYWASIPCVPLLGPANPLWRAQQAAGIASPALGWPRPRSLLSREAVLLYLQEAAQFDAVTREGGVFISGEARLVGPGRVEVGPQQLEAAHIVIATGGAPRIPAIPGLAEMGFWTTRQATTAAAVPQGVVILGGDAQAVELGQMFRLCGAEVTLITHHSDLFDQEDAEIGQLMIAHLQQHGIRVLLQRTVVRAAREGDATCVLTLDDGAHVRGRQVVVASGRTSRTEGLDRAGVQVGPHGILVDAYCRAAEGIWAIGDVTGVAPLSHLAQYQAHVAADAILGRAHPAEYLAVPRVLFTDPQVAATGLTRAQMREQGLNALTVTMDLAERRRQQGRPAAAYQPPGERLALHADRTRGVLVGAWAVSPEAGEWIQLAALAISAAIPLAVAHDMLEQFPAFGDVYLSAIDQLLRDLTPLGASSTR